VSAQPSRQKGRCHGVQLAKLVNADAVSTNEYFMAVKNIEKADQAKSMEKSRMCYRLRRRAKPNECGEDVRR
jgi:hypothetical protein